MLINFNLGMITGGLSVVIMSGTLTRTGDAVLILVCLVFSIIAGYRANRSEK